MILALLAHAGTDAVVLHLHGAHGTAGHVRCGLYANEAVYLKTSTKEAESVISAGNATCTFTGLTAGTYAIAVWHDADDDETIDTNVFGIPSEGLAWSNDARARYGPATWTEAAFSYAGGALSLDATLRY